MNSINNTKYSYKRKYTDLLNADTQGVKSVKNIYGKRHTINVVKPKLTKLSKIENDSRNISVKNKNTIRISRKYTACMEYSLSVKKRNSHIHQRY